MCSIAPYAIFSAFPKIDGFIVAPFFFVCKVCSRPTEGDDGDFGAVSDAHRNAAAAAKAAADHEAGSVDASIAVRPDAPIIVWIAPCAIENSAVISSMP